MIPNAFAGQTVAVTGAAGFLGGRLVERLAATPCRLLRVARRPLPALEFGSTAPIDVVGDLADQVTWDRVVAAADVVLHCAAQTSAVVAEENPAADFQANVTPMRHLVAACHKCHRHPVVIFAGTVTQAGLPSRLPVDEDVADQPVTVYDRHKLLAEAELKSAALHGTLLGGSLRLSNVYGPGAARPRPGRDVLNRMIKMAVAGEGLTVYGSGEFVRDYLFIDDVVEAFMLAAMQAAAVNARHFIVGSGSAITVRQAFELIASRVEALTGRHVPVTMVAPRQPLPAIDGRNFVANPARFIAATGWRPAYTLAQGIDRTIEALTCG